MKFIRDIFNKKKHNMLFFVLLWFLPIIALNVGYGFLSRIHANWAVQKQQEFAQQEVEALSSSSDFSFQFSSHAGDFESLFKGYAESLPNTKLLSSYIETSVNKTFGPLFPDYDLFVFHLPKKGRGEVLYHKTDGVLMRRAYTNAFKYMVDLSLDNPVSAAERQNGKNFLGRVLNSPIDVDAIIESQRAKRTYSFYKLDTHNFFWNFFELPSKGTYGYFLFCKNQPSNEEKSKKLALEKLNTSLPRTMGAFFPLFENYGEAIYQHEFMADSKLLQDWAKKVLPKNDKMLKDWLRREMSTGVELGNYTLYSSVGTGQTHLAVLLFPKVEVEPYPPWLYATTLIYVAILLLIIFKGIFMGAWPEISLKNRFTVSYLMASVLPVSLLVITLYGYLIQYKEASYLQALSNLQANMNEFDSRKSQLLEEYLSAFKEALEDEGLENILREEGVESKAALKKILEFFYDGSQPLPLASIQVFDEGGLGGGLVFDRYGREVAGGGNKVENLMYPLCINLRNHKLQAGIEPSLVKEFKPTVEEELAMAAFQALERESLSTMMDERRSMIVATEEGARTSLHVHDYVMVDGKPFCSLSIRWDDQALDSSTYEKTENYLYMKNPEFSYVPYRSEPQGLVLFKEVSRHIAARDLGKYQHQAQMSVFKNSYSHGQENNMFFYAMPSKKYKDLIFVGSGQLDRIISSTYIRYIILSIILILTILVILSCSYISSKVILEPISGLKEALDEVAENRLALEITSANKDELGQLCYRFSTMVEGLREREKLATLISDQAVEAISKTGGHFVTETFDGVALVSDIRGFTAACEKYDPALVTELLNEHFAQMSKIISEQGGRIYKYIGDAIEAVFPEDERYSESACMRAFTAASRMVVKLVQINQQRRKSKLFTYRIGIGLKYGEMHSGAVGSLDTRLDYAIVGDALRAAAQLEALSVVNPAFPVIIDHKVNQVLSNTGLGFELIPDIDHIKGYTLNNLGAIDLDMGVSDEDAGGVAKPSSSYESANELNKFRYIKAGEGIGFSQKLAFIAGLLFILLTSCVTYLGYTSVINTKLDAVKLESAHLNMRMMDQLKTEKLVVLAYENICRSYLDELEERFNETTDVEKLQACVKQTGEELKAKGYVDRYLAYYYQYDKKSPLFSELARDGIKRESALRLSEILLRLARKEKFDVFRPTLATIFDESMKMDVAKNYLTSSAFISGVNDLNSSSENLQPAYNYLDYICDYDEEPFNSNSPKGIVFFSRATDLEEEVMLNMLLDGYSIDGELHIAIKPNDISNNVVEGANSWVYSSNFPENFKEKIVEDDISSDNDFFIALKDALEVENRKYGLVLVREIPEKYRGNYSTFYFWLILLTSAFLILLYRMVQGESFVTKSVAAKLWLALIAVAVIPMITVVFLFELYLNEEENVRLAHRQLELQNFLRRIEMVYNFTNPSGWKKIEEFCYSDDFLSILRDVAGKDVKVKDKHLESDYADLNEMVSSWKHYLKEHPSMEHFDIREVVVAAEDWWKTAGANYVASDFTRLLGEIGFKLTGMAKKKSFGSAEPSLTEAKNEMFLDTSLNMLRASFGDDIYVKMPNAIRSPLTMKVDNSNLGFVIHVLPNLQDAEFTILWLVMFKRNFNALAASYNSYQDSLASMELSSLSDEEDSGFRVFTSQQNQWGYMNMGKFYKERNFFKRIAAYVATSNLPITTSFKNNNVDYLVESNVGVNLSTQILLGMADKMDITKALQEARESFYWALVLSLFLIVLTANNIAKDILIPVRELTAGMVQTNEENYSYRIGIERTDELGVLCSSYDLIMKGLEERSLMRKMLSSTAQKETLREEEGESRKADCVLLYIGIPDFRSYMTSLEPDNLFVELKRHVAEVAGIILTEGGEIDKIIGDKQLIAFYVENDDMDAAIEKAVKASLRICKAESSGSLPFPVAIGVSAGSVVTGFLGVGEKRDFTLIGDTVNIAARIEALAEKQRVDRCLIADNVYESIKDRFPGSLLGEVELKGKEAAIKVYSLFGAE